MAESLDNSIMAKFTRLEVATKMAETGMVPLFYHSDIEVAKKTLKACYHGGARLLEFTSRGDFAHLIFEELNKYVIAELPDMILGVGSITVLLLHHFTCNWELIL